MEIATLILENDKNGPLVYETTEIEDGEGRMTCLHVACEWNSIDLVELYFSYGGEQLVRIKNGEGLDAIDFSYAENMEGPYGYLNK